ncbi:MAG: type III PLP-dependent enzyme domain-containing protein [Planctomycetota bacterium]|jgi:diaminopimelate decarboxylase
MTHSQIQNLASQYGSPFYLVDRNRFESNFDDLVTAFGSRYSPFILAYSYKTNYLPYLCNIIRQKGGWAEVGSRMEYDLAIKIGQDPKKIIFNGPVKTADDIALALDNGSSLNVDSEAELAMVIDYAQQHPERQVPIGLRINIGLSDEAGQSHIQNSLKVGRFGLDPANLLMANGSWLKAENNLKVVSLHGHTSTTDRSKWCFEVIAKTLCEMAQEYFPESVETINIGGGFFGHMHPDMPFKDAPSFDEYAEVVCNILNDNTWAQKKKPTLLIEPGVAMVADAVSFITKVVSVKPIKERTFVTVDGSAFNTKPTFHAVNMPHQIIRQNEEGPTQTFDVVGSTCMEKDILLKDITAPLPQPGDYIRIDSIGAYTLVMTPPFINPAPAILADEAGQVKCVRKKQTMEDIFSNYRFEQ